MRINRFLSTSLIVLAATTAMVSPGFVSHTGMVLAASEPSSQAIQAAKLAIKGDFVVRDGDAYTSNMTLRGPAAEIGLLGRTNFRTREYNQTVVVTGELGASLGVAGALAAGPAVGAALLLFSQLFKEPLKGMTRGYYRITGTWDAPIVQSVTAAAARDFRRDSQAAPPGEPSS